MDIKGKDIIANVTIIRDAVDKDTITSDETLFWHRWICHCFIAQAICIFGTVTNILNIVCFIKLKFNDSVNVTLLGLAVSDLGCLVTTIWYNICMTPVFRDADLPFDVDDMLYLLGGWTHATFARITSFLTAFLTLERCLCIAMPLKVKVILTSKRVTIFVMTVFILLLAGVSPAYCVTRLGDVFVASRNKSILAAIPTEGRMSVYTGTIIVNNVVIPFAAFATVIICTATLVVSLHRKTKWRQSASAVNSEQSVSRDQKVSKMVLIISTVFIVCFIPTAVSCLTVSLVPELDMYGRFRNTCLLIFGINFTIESANSSVNIFIYYNMSTKFRATFRELLKMPLK
ncbi:hypothetical protein BsWGS_10889 [Bradybaena similaris]